MSTYRLKNLLSPRSVALVGASPRQGSVGRAILANLKKVEFRGELGLVNPRYAEIEGAAAVSSWALMQLIIEYARSEGLKAISGDVLQENTTMLTMCRDLGFEVKANPVEHGICNVKLKL